MISKLEKTAFNKANSPGNRILNGVRSVIFLGSMQLACSQPTPLPNPEQPAAQLYQNNCSWCHSLPHPGRHTATEWEHYMKLMQIHRLDRNLPALNSSDYQQIQEYLQVHARK